MPRAPATRELRRQREERRGNLRDAFEPTEELVERPVGGAEQVTLAVRAALHRRAEGRGRVARVHEAQAALRHRRDFAREEVEHDLRRTQTLVAGAEQKARVHDDEPPTLPRKVLKRDALLIDLARVVGPARDDVEGRRPLLVGQHVAVFGDGHRPARRGHHQRLDARPGRRLAQHARPVHVQLVHQVRVLGLARDAAGEVVDLRHALDRPPHVLRRSDRARRPSRRPTLRATPAPKSRARAASSRPPRRAASRGATRGTPSRPSRASPASPSSRAKSSSERRPRPSSPSSRPSSWCFLRRRHKS